MPRVHVSIVTYNAASYLAPCLASLAESTLPVRAVAYDNTSSDGTPEVIRQFPHVELVETGKNLGYAKGNNLGMARALRDGADYLLLLDQDARIFPDTVEKLVAFAETHPEYGVVSPIHLAGNETELDPHFRRYLLQAHPAALDGALVARSAELGAGGREQGAGGRGQLSVVSCQLSEEKENPEAIFTALTSPAKRDDLQPSSASARDLQPPHDQAPSTTPQAPSPKHEAPSTTPQAPSPKHQAPSTTPQARSTKHQAPSMPRVLDVPMVNSAIWLISRKCLETVGGFDPIYFQYNADKDYCYRLHYHGFKLGIATHAFAVHAHIKTLSAEEEAKLVFESPDRQFAFYATEIKKPHVSFKREFVSTLALLTKDGLSCLFRCRFSQTKVKLIVIGKLLSTWRTIRDHQARCRTPGSHWIDRELGA